jgi:hypothetical protein
MTAFDKKIKASDKCIEDAVAILSQHERGQAVLGAFYVLMNDAGAFGLDCQGWSALHTLVVEAAAGRRDFVGDFKQYKN